MGIKVQIEVPPQLEEDLNAILLQEERRQRGL